MHAYIRRQSSKQDSALMVLRAFVPHQIFGVLRLAKSQVFRKQVRLFPIVFFLGNRW